MSTNLPDEKYLKDRIFSMLKPGIDNAVKGKDLADALNTDLRTIQRIIQKMRIEDGIPIAASCKTSNPGYYLISDMFELHEYYNALYHRAIMILYALSRCKKISLNELFAQLKLKLENHNAMDQRTP